MDSLKKRKLEDNTNGLIDPTADPSLSLTPQESRKMLETLTKDQLLDILQDALISHVDILNAVRSFADPDSTLRKLFVRGLGYDTTTETLRSVFSAYGELEEAIVILDKTTGKSKGYGFVTFKHVDGAVIALREPSKRIDGRVAVAQLAAAGNQGGGGGANSNSVDVSDRKIYVGNVPVDMSAERLLSVFSGFGEIEEGPLGFDKVTGKSRGFALFVYKTPMGAQAAVAEPIKNVDGRQLNCKFAIDGKKKPGPVGPGGIPPPGGVHGDGMNMNVPGSMPGPHGGGGLGSYGGGYPGSIQGQPAYGPLNTGGPGMSVAPGSQPPSVMAGAGGGSGGGGGGGYVGGMSGGPYSSYGSGGPGYNGTGVGGAAGGSSMYRPSGGYPDSGNYGLSSSSGYPGQLHQPSGAPPVPRVPSGGMYPSGPPYY